MIWIPSDGGGPDAAFRYRDAVAPLHEAELQESYDDALRRIESFSANTVAPLGEWGGHAPALSVYAQWVVYALRSRGAVDEIESDRRLLRLAHLQRRDGLHNGYPGIHRGRSAGWSSPSWWGGSIHKAHRDALIRLAPERYTAAHFTVPRPAARAPVGH